MPRLVGRDFRLPVAPHRQVLEDRPFLVVDIGQGRCVGDQQRLGDMAQPGQTTLVDEAQDRLELHGRGIVRRKTAGLHQHVAAEQPVTCHPRRETQQVIQVERRPEGRTEAAIGLAVHLVAVHGPAIRCRQQFQARHQQAVGGEFIASVDQGQPVEVGVTQ
ncbi:hypothetical protein FQZ97_907480 [compost metagenome]